MVHPSSKDKIDAVGQLCTGPFGNKDIPIGLEYASPEIVNIMTAIKSNISPYLLCTWRNKAVGCRANFSRVITGVGVCYTFNNLDQSAIFREENLHKDYRYFEKHRPMATEWSLETGYLENATWYSYPERVLRSGERGELGILMPFKIADVDSLCQLNKQGMRIALHAPGDIPDLNDQYIRLNLNQQMRMIVTPNLITTSPNLDHYPVERRQCYFQEERHLRFFKIYSQANCEFECLTNYTLEMCGCVHYSMPRNSSTRICGLKKNGCRRRAVEEHSNPYSGLSHQICHCMPSCTSISYQTETDQSEYHMINYFDAQDIPREGLWLTK